MNVYEQERYARSKRIAHGSTPDPAETAMTLVWLTSRLRTGFHGSKIRVCDLVREHSLQIIHLDELTILQDAKRALFILQSKHNALQAKHDALTSRPKICPDCKSAVRIVKGEFGKFLACVGYYKKPRCRWTSEIED